MADRFPLILNTSVNQIQEIPSGDQLDLTGNNIANAGIVTANAFHGDGSQLTGVTSVGGNNGVDFNDDIKVRFGDNNELTLFFQNAGNRGKIGTTNSTALDILTANTQRVVIENSGHVRPAINNSYDLGTAGDRWRNINGVAGNFSGDLTVTGNASIGGVLTYEDVTNVDSIGVITARSGVLVGSGITLSPDGDVFATGVTTSTTFVGALTGNVTGNASGSSGSCTGNAATATALETARNIGGVSFDGSANIDLPGVNSSGNQDTSGNADTATTLATARNIGGVSFDGSANIDLPGVNSAGNQNTSGTAAGLSGTPNISCGTIAGSTGTFTGDVDIADKIVHTGDTNTAIRFPAADTITAETGGSERLRIASDGKIGINNNSPTCQLQIDTGASGDGTVTALELNHKGNDTNDAVKLNFARAGSDIGSIVLEKVASNNTTDFIFNTRSFNTVSESMRITGAGSVGIGTDSPNGSSLGSNTGLVHLKDMGSGNTALKVQHGSVHAYFAADNNDLTIATRSNHFMQFQTNSLERLRITSTGLIRMGNGAQANTESHITAAIFQNVTGTATILKLGNTNTPSSANNRAIEFCDGTGGTEGSSKYTYARIKAERSGGSNAGRLILSTKPNILTPSLSNILIPLFTSKRATS